MPADILTWLDRHWRIITLLAWLAAGIFLIADAWSRIHTLTLGDNDDNMRLMQVRAWLDGQGWFDLRQYRLNPPEGFDIHWSRLVDIPLAGIILLVKPLLGLSMAERASIAVAPILPLGLAFSGIALAARRLIAPAAFLVALPILLTATSAIGMFYPT